MPAEVVRAPRAGDSPRREIRLELGSREASILKFPTALIELMIVLISAAWSMPELNGIRTRPAPIGPPVPSSNSKTRVTVGTWSSVDRDASRRRRLRCR